MNRFFHRPSSTDGTYTPNYRNRHTAYGPVEPGLGRVRLAGSAVGAVVYVWILLSLSLSLSSIRDSLHTAQALRCIMKSWGTRGED
jgi:hypothetical protein